MSDQTLPRYAVIFIFIAATLVYVFGLFVKVMDVDAAQYASISREMLQNHHYLEVLHRGHNYLDKPPLLFWLATLSFKLLGISTFAYKLPAFLFTLLGVYSTYRIARLLYDENTGLLAAMILYTCQAFFLFNNDVRADAILTGSVAFGCWQLLLFSNTQSIKHLLLGFTGVALAMCAKGPIGAVVPAAALFAHFAYRGEMKKLLWWQWYAGLGFAILLLSPMLYGLYRQFGTEGPKFFFWTQSFGRITGENVWHNDAGYFYFVHNFLWSFLPWSIIALVAVISQTFQLLKGRSVSNKMTEAFSLGGAVLPFIALSFSHYKLPHYVFVIYPLTAVLTAGFIMQQIRSNEQLLHFFSYLQLIIAAGITAGAIYLAAYIFPATNIFLWIITGFLLFLIFYFFFSAENLLSRIILPCALAIITVDFLFNIHVYPALIEYQSGSELAAMAIHEHVPKDQVYFYNYGSHAFEFYFQKITPSISSYEIRSKKIAGDHFWLIGGEDLIRFLKKQNIHWKQVLPVDDFTVTRLSIDFLNPETRSSQLKKKYLVEM